MRNFNPQGPRGGPGGPVNPPGSRGGPGQGVNTNFNIAEAPGSKGAGRIVDQAMFTNMLAQAVKDNLFRRFDDGMKSLVLHPNVDSETAKREMPRYYQAFGSILESRAGKDMRPVMQNLFQHFYNRARRGPRREEDGRR